MNKMIVNDGVVKRVNAEFTVTEWLIVRQALKMLSENKKANVYDRCVAQALLLKPNDFEER